MFRNISLVGLIIFIVCVAVDVIVLLFDFGLWLFGLVTITDWVKDGHHAFVYPLVGWQLLAAIGLAVHLTVKASDKIVNGMWRKKQ